MSLKPCLRENVGFRSNYYGLTVFPIKSEESLVPQSMVIHCGDKAYGGPADIEFIIEGEGQNGGIRITAVWLEEGVEPDPEDPDRYSMSTYWDVKTIEEAKDIIRKARTYDGDLYVNAYDVMGDLNFTE